MFPPPSSTTLINYHNLSLNFLMLPFFLSTSSTYHQLPHVQHQKLLPCACFAFIQVNTLLQYGEKNDKAIQQRTSFLMYKLFLSIGFTRHIHLNTWNFLIEQTLLKKKNNIELVSYQLTIR